MSDCASTHVILDPKSSLDIQLLIVLEHIHKSQSKRKRAKDRRNRFPSTQWLREFWWYLMCFFTQEKSLLSNELVNRPCTTDPSALRTPFTAKDAVWCLVTNEYVVLNRNLPTRAVCTLRTHEKSTTLKWVAVLWLCKPCRALATS